MDALWAMRLTLSASDAVLWLALLFNGSVKTDEIFPALTPVFFRTDINRKGTFVLTLIIMHKDSWDINTIRTRHAILTVVTRNGLHLHYLFSNAFEHGILFFRSRFQRTVSEEVIL
jgi:hypothetical protein